MKNIFIIFLLALPVLLTAGNPDRQGEAGAYELLLNPWGASAGLNLMNTGSISGVEAMRLNPAGIHFEGRTQMIGGHMRLFDGSGIAMNSAGLAFKLGENGTVGFSLSSMDFGDTPVTTVLQPEGTGGTFSPNFVHLGVGYSHSFKDKIFVGILFRGISQQVIDVSALGIAMDAGVQYRGGTKDRVRLGISLRNVGPSMRFSGEGLTQEVVTTAPQTESYFLRATIRPSKYELPTVLNLGASYDFFLAGGRDYIRTFANFTSNAFARDNIGVAAEYSFRNTFMVRGGYQVPIGQFEDGTTDIYTGISAGFSVNVKTSKKPEAKNRIGVDYAYRTTQHFRGTHNIGIRYTIF